MKPFIRIVATAFFFFTAWTPSQASPEFTTGNEQFSAGQYEPAARSYRLALDKGAHSAELYFNLGLAEARAGKTAEASLQFQRALVLNPALVAARRELLALSAQANLEVPEATWSNRLASAVPTAPLWIAGAIVAWLGAFIILGGLFAKSRRGIWLAIGGGLFILGKATLFLAWSSDPLVENQNLAVLVVDGPNRLRSAPVENSNTVASLVGGSTVALISERGKWVYAATLAGQRGWIERSSVEPVIPRKS